MGTSSVNGFEASAADLPSGHAFSDDHAVMRYAIRLALRGRGRVEPNPMVGAVLVNNDRCLAGQGWHEEFGGLHAENIALRSVTSARGLRMFVTLEPCNHHGKTPPCSEALIDAGIREVAIGCEDPAHHASSSGIERLRQAGIGVEVGVCREEALQLIAPFARLHCECRPWVHAKWAMTLDGRIAAATGHSQWISSPDSRREVHRLRGLMDAIITGAGTVRADDPLLTARPPGSRTPARIVMDADGSCLAVHSQLVSTLSQAPVFAAIAQDQPENVSNRLLSLGIEVLRLPRTADRKLCVGALLDELGRRRMTHVMIEAGSAVMGNFFDRDLVDEVHIFVAPKIVGGAAALSPVGGTGLAEVPQRPDLQDVDIRRIGDDVLIQGRIARKN